MELQQLRVLVVLAEEGSMTGAARRLSITQPAISAALRQLEQEIGFSLFHRSRRGLTLTARAVDVLDRARAVLRTTEEIKNAGALGAGDSGEVRVAGRPGFMQYVFPHMLKRLHSELPGITITNASSGTSSEVVAALRTGQADLVFAASPNIKSITAEVIFHDPVWLAVARDHPLAKRRSLTFKDLASQQFCVPAVNDRLRGPIDKLLRQTGARKAVAIETNDYTVMKNLIAVGGYVGFVYGHMMLSADSADIVPLKISGMDLVRDLTVLHRRDDLLPHVARAREVLVADAIRVLEANRKRFGKQ